jgi:hypothetical protein
MKITINIKTDNAAFQDGNREDEIFRIVGVFNRRIANGETGGSCSDSNGNTVGNYKVTGK